MYLMLAASDDVETQRMGICSVVLPGVKFSAQKESNSINLDRIVFMKRVYGSLPIRTASIHFCLPNTPFTSLFKTVFILTMPSFRKRMKFHAGKSVLFSVVSVVATNSLRYISSRSLLLVFFFRSMK
jgi:hypothetical protein